MVPGPGVIKAGELIVACSVRTPVREVVKGGDLTGCLRRRTDQSLAKILKLGQFNHLMPFRMATNRSKNNHKNKTQKITSMEKDVEKLKHLHTVGGSVTRCHCFGKIKNGITFQ